MLDIPGQTEGIANRDGAQYCCDGLESCNVSTKCWPDHISSPVSTAQLVIYISRSLIEYSNTSSTIAIAALS